MEPFSALLALCAGNSPVPGEFPAQRPVTRSFDVFFDQCLNKRLSKQPWGWWFDTPSWSLWRQCNDTGQDQAFAWLHSRDVTATELLWPFTRWIVSEKPLRWRHNGCDSVSNHQPHDCLLNLLFRRRSKKTSKLRVTGRCAWNSPGTGEFPAQMASNAEIVSIWWRHHALTYICILIWFYTTVLLNLVQMHLKRQEPDYHMLSMLFLFNVLLGQCIVWWCPGGVSKTLMSS